MAVSGKISGSSEILQQVLKRVDNPTASDIHNLVQLAYDDRKFDPAELLKLRTLVSRVSPGVPKPNFTKLVKDPSAYLSRLALVPPTVKDLEHLETLMRVLVQDATRSKNSERLLRFVQSNPDKNLVPALKAASEAKSPALRPLLNFLTVLSYPSIPEADKPTTHHGQVVPNPYSYLSDLNDPRTIGFLQAQRELENNFLKWIPEVAELKAGLKEVSHYTSYINPGSYHAEISEDREGNVYYWEQRPDSPQQILRKSKGKENEKPDVVLDVSQLPGVKGKEAVEITSFELSPDGKMAAYCTREKGSGWKTLRIVNLKTHEIFDELKGLKSHGWPKSYAVWSEDSKGFYYAKEYPDDKTGRVELCYHGLKTPQEKDRIVDSKGDGNVLGSNSYMASTRLDGVLKFKDLTEDPSIPFKEIKVPKGSELKLIGRGPGKTLLAYTDHKASWGRIVQIDPEDPREEKWQDFVPEKAGSKEKLDGYFPFRIAKGKLFVPYMIDVHSVVRVYDIQSGKLDGELPLPGIGDISINPGPSENGKVYFTYTSFLTPPITYSYDVDQPAGIRQTPEVLLKTEAPGIDPDKFEADLKFFSSPSIDGKLEKVPLWIFGEKGVPPSPDDDIILYGYGGFAAAVLPTYESERLFLLNWAKENKKKTGKNLRFAIVNARGGDEYGKDWVERGKGLNKPNTFNDFIAASEWLIANKYTRAGHIALQGRSGGGINVLTVMLMRPDLFGAVVPSVPATDLINSTVKIGNEYGDRSDPQGFQMAFTCSPLYHVKPGINYPPVHISHGEGDSTVHVSHTLRMVAQLQNKGGREFPAIAHILKNSGHSAGDKADKIAELTHEMAFILFQLGWIP